MKNIPIYQVIENDIKSKIKSGLLSQGEMIPSENELKEKYSVSRMTVRQALTNLVNDGYLYKHKGKGTFVNTMKIEKKIQGLVSFTEEMTKMNRKVTNKIVSIELIPADEEVSAKLFLNKDDLVYLIERIRYGDNIPVLFEQLYVPNQLFKEIDKEMLKGSFYHYVEDILHLNINYSIQTIEARLATPEIADYLEISRPTSVLHISLNSFLDNGRPFEYVKSYYRADQYRFIQHAVR